MQELLKILRDITPSLLLLGLAIYLQPVLAGTNIVDTPFLQSMPLIFLAIGAVLSWKFNRHQSFYLQLMSFVYVAILLLVIDQPLDLSQFKTSVILAMFTIFVPINFLIFEIWQVNKPICIARFGHLGLIGIEILFCFWIVSQNQIVIGNALNNQLLPNFVLIPEHIPHASVLLFFIALLYQGLKGIINQDAVDLSTLAGLFTLLWAFYFIETEAIHIVLFSALGLMSCIAIIQESFNVAFTDPLTRLPSRRALNGEMANLGDYYCIALVDVDNFTVVNNNYGHEVGDQVLRLVAKHLRRITGGGVAARYIGETFAIIFSGISISDASRHLENLRESIADSNFAIRKKPRPKKIPKTKPIINHKKEEIKLTISIGIAEKNRAHRNADDVISAADIALNEAKKTGRNKLCY